MQGKNNRLVSHKIVFIRNSSAVFVKLINIIQEFLTIYYWSKKPYYFFQHCIFSFEKQICLCWASEFFYFTIINQNIHLDFTISITHRHFLNQILFSLFSSLSGKYAFKPYWKKLLTAMVLFNFQNINQPSIQFIFIIWINCIQGTLNINLWNRIMSNWLVIATNLEHHVI